MYKILAQFKNGLLTENEALAMLNKKKVRGSFSGDGEKYGFLGFDFTNQSWVAIKIK